MGHSTRKLTQVNKSHKGKSKSKTVNEKPKMKINKKKIVNDSKELRVLKAEQHRKHSIKSNMDSDYSKRGDNDSAPLLCGVFPLFDFEDIEVVFSLLKSTDQEAIIKKIDDLPNYSRFNCENFIMKSNKFKKNFAFTACRNFRDRFDYLDLAKVVDWCLFILPNDLDELIGDYTEDLISGLIAQGMPSSCFISLNNSRDFKLKDECKYLESIIKINLGEDRIQCLNNSNDANKLMRHLAQNCKSSFNASKKSTISKKSMKEKRGYFVVQQMNFNEETKEMRVTGCMRGFGIDLSTTKFLHLTEIGDFPIKQVEWISPLETNRFTENTKLSSLKRFELERNKEESSERKDCESEDEEMEENSEIESESEDEEDFGMEDEEEEEISDIGSVDSDNDPQSDRMSFATTAHSGYSVAQILKFKQSREDSMFPDEVEISYNEKAREKFKKYRGLLKFDSVWPIDLNLPKCYQDITQMKKYKHERNRLCNRINRLDKTNQQEKFILPGSRFEMILEEFSNPAFDKLKSLIELNPNRHLIGCGLFEFEEKISVLHFNERRLATVDDSVVNELAKLSPSNDSAIQFGEDATSHYDNIGDEKYTLKPAAEPIESKETMLFQVGFRRFSSTPIYSQFTATSDEPGDKGKSRLCKFMELKKNVVATAYGPITFGPTSVLQFRIRQIDLGMGEMSRPFVAEMVASGSLLSVDTTRPIIKRILLSGQIYKVNKRSVMIRYMFFNKEDIDHFKTIPLHTRSNNAGRIISNHGTHGYMKCHFSKPISQDEVVFMPLYKRVFPKYTVADMYNHLPNAEQIDNEDRATLDVMDKLF